MSVLAPVHIEYHWREGSVPPPEHYRLTIEAVTNGGGKITLVPGYLPEPCVQWVDFFEIAPRKASSFEAYLQTARIFERRWPEMANDTVGGSQRNFRLRRGATSIAIPDGLSASDASAADALEQQIRRLVPDDIWHILRKRHAAYVESGEWQ